MQACVYNITNHHLDAKKVLTGMSAQQCPFAVLGLQQVGRECHLPAGDVGAQPFAQAPEWQVANGGQWGQVGFSLDALGKALLACRLFADGLGRIGQRAAIGDGGRGGGRGGLLGACGVDR